MESIEVHHIVSSLLQSDCQQAMTARIPLWGIVLESETIFEDCESNSVVHELAHLRTRTGAQFGMIEIFKLPQSTVFCSFRFVFIRRNFTFCVQVLPQLFVSICTFSIEHLYNL